MITHALIMAYRDLRAPRFSPYGDKRHFYTSPAASALRGARHTLADQLTREEWDAADGYTCEHDNGAHHPDAHAYDTGHVRIVCHSDDTGYSVDDCDTYSPECHPEIKPEIIAREREAEIDRVNQDGVWGYVAEFWTGDDWENVDSIWGFVGNDFETSGYEPDLMRAALDALNALREGQARDLEASRPDMYL